MIIRKPTKRHIPELKALWKQAFSDTDEYIDAFFETAFSVERCLLAEKESKTVSALYWFDCEYLGKKVAYLYAIATFEKYRGKGFCSTLMNSAKETLKELGYSGALLMPSNKELFEFYGRLGYKEVCCVDEFSAVASRPTALHKIDAAEYFELRKKYLKPSHVVQEGVNIDFMTIQAEFYSGEDFILALENENGEIFGTEILGNTSAAGGILAALGYREAMFRTVGKSKPFVLWQPLGTKPLPCPEYFGLAFD